MMSHDETRTNGPLHLAIPLVLEHASPGLFRSDPRHATAQLQHDVMYEHAIVATVNEGLALMFCRSKMMISWPKEKEKRKRGARGEARSACVVVL